MKELLRQIVILMYALSNRVVNNTQDREVCMNHLITICNDVKNVKGDKETEELMHDMQETITLVENRIRLDNKWDVENEKFFSY